MNSLPRLDVQAAEAAAEFTAEVMDFREVGNQEGVRLYQMALTRSAFSPQRCRGVLTATSRNGHTLEVEVIAVEEDADGVLWHTAKKPLQPGIAVTGRLPSLKHL